MSFRLTKDDDRMLRWLVPYFLIILFALDLALVNHPFYSLILAIQIGFYG